MTATAQEATPRPSAREAPIKDVRACAYKIPTDKLEADGTLAWTSTTLVIAEVDAGGRTGLGYTYRIRPLRR